MATDSTSDVDWYDFDDGYEGDFVEAINWAYLKLLAFGVGGSERDALMLDRIKLFLETGEW